MAVSVLSSREARINESDDDDDDASFPSTPSILSPVTHTSTSTHYDRISMNAEFNAIRWIDDLRKSLEETCSLSRICQSDIYRRTFQFDCRAGTIDDDTQHQYTINK